MVTTSLSIPFGITKKPINCGFHSPTTWLDGVTETCDSRRPPEATASGAPAPQRSKSCDCFWLQFGEMDRSQGRRALGRVLLRMVAQEEEHIWTLPSGGKCKRRQAFFGMHQGFAHHLLLMLHLQRSTYTLFSTLKRCAVTQASADVHAVHNCITTQQNHTKKTLVITLPLSSRCTEVPLGGKHLWVRAALDTIATPRRKVGAVSRVFYHSARHADAREYEWRRPHPPERMGPLEPYQKKVTARARHLSPFLARVASSPTEHSVCVFRSSTALGQSFPWPSSRRDFELGLSMPQPTTAWSRSAGSSTETPHGTCSGSQGHGSPRSNALAEGEPLDPASGHPQGS